MRPLLGLALFASCGAMAVTGCAANAALSRTGPAATAPSTRAPASSQAPSSSASPSPSATPSPRQRAEADAAAIRASFVPPPGARRLTAAPGAGGGVLKQPVQIPGTPDLVDDTSWWQAPGQPTAVLAWEKAHLPSRFASDGSSISSQYGVPTAWSDEFSLPAVPAVLISRELVVEVVSAGKGQTAIRVDSQVTWLPAKPPGERVPAGATSVTITELPGLSRGKPPAPVTITNRDEVRRIASLADSLPVFPPGDYSCPADDGLAVNLTFRGAHGQVLAVVVADQTGCGTVSFTVGGKSLLTLWDGETFVRQVLKVAGLHWPGSQTGVMMPG